MNTKQILKHTFTFAMSLCMATASVAQESAVRKGLEDRLGASGVKIDSIAPAPIAGLFEVRIGNEILYSDSKGEFLILGQIQDLKTGRNFTQERLDNLANAAIFAPENLKNALKMVVGDGKTQIAIFEDANCGYCKKMRVELDKVKNATIYTYLIPILSEDSETKMKNVWCSTNPNKAYDDWMLRGVNPQTTAKAGCVAPVEANSALAKSLKINGTPHIIVAGKPRIGGYVSGEQLNEVIAQ